MSDHPGKPTDDEQDAAAESFYAPPLAPDAGADPQGFAGLPERLQPSNLPHVADAGAEEPRDYPGYKREKALRIKAEAEVAQLRVVQAQDREEIWKHLGTISSLEHERDALRAALDGLIQQWTKEIQGHTDLASGMQRLCIADLAALCAAHGIPQEPPA